MNFKCFYKVLLQNPNIVIVSGDNRRIDENFN